LVRDQSFRYLIPNTVRAADPPWRTVSLVSLDLLATIALQGQPAEEGFYDG
jgi:hypothetical protein